MVDFSGFSADSFEQFIRALAIHVIGPGVTAFGDGPDGGREATFSGKVPFPFPPEQHWEGYGVFQAKFKSTSEGVSKDQAWAIQQAKSELDKWLLSPKRKPKAEYFIFCTNVSLSSASGGGKDKLAKLLNLKKYGLKGHAIWDLNQLRVYIDNAPDIRNRFRALFTPGDLLAAFADKLQMGDGIDAESVLTTYITREFLTEEDARLSQAGDRTEDRIRLADVFVDLPSGPEPRIDPTNAEDAGLRPASICELLRVGARKLDPLALFEGREALKANANQESSALVARFVFLGGPGSGKSTIGQFLAQIHRAALLKRRPQHRLEENIVNLVDVIKKRCTSDGYDWPTTPRYPFRVELNSFAKALSGAAELKVSSLSEYLRRSLSKTTQIQHAHLRSWLMSYPWLLILDGLDEVPVSSNRKQVIEAIQEFLNEARDVESDLLIIASSRPDGYAGEFDGGEVAHRYLHPLSATRAISCAEKYVHAKIARKNDHRAEEVIETLRSAVINPLIAKLMYSPLQVTFMVTVVAASGKPSESRWRLFSEYYKTIYERELQKAVPPFDKALSARRSDIDALHHRVGFILQNRAELSGGTQSDISIDEFKSIVRECLGELGLTSQVLEREVEMIVGAANQRLVFLTSRTPGRLSFDVRSLQEYMAAACLTNTDSAEAMPRLEQIAHSAYWRNVTMFAVGRFFDEPQLRTHRGKIRVLCEDLNQEPEENCKGLVGSKLAVDILISGVMGDVPTYARALGKIALELLEFPQTSDDHDAGFLAEIYRPEMEVEYKNATNLRLGQIEIDRSIAAWWLLNSLIEKNVAWALIAWKEYWPQDLTKQKTIFDSFSCSSFGPIKLGSHLTTVAKTLIPQLEPIDAVSSLRNISIQSDVTIPGWLVAMTKLLQGETTVQIKLYYEDKPVGVDARLHKIDDKTNQSYARLTEILSEPFVNKSWLPVTALAKFVANPNSDALSEAVVSVRSAESDLLFWKAIAPWPVVQLMSSSGWKELLLHSGSCPWLIVEEAFNKDGLELESMLKPNISLDRVTPESIKSWIVNDRKAEGQGRVFLNQTLAALAHMDSIIRKNILSSLFAGASSIYDILQEFDPITINERVLLSQDIWAANSFSLKLSAQEKIPPAWERFFEGFGNCKLIPADRFSPRLSSLGNWCLGRYAENKSQIGLMKIAGFCSASLSVVGARKTLANNFDLKQVVNNINDPQSKFAAIAIELIIDGGDKSRLSYVIEILKSLLKDDKNKWGAELILDVLERNLLQHYSYLCIIDVLVESQFGNLWKIRSRSESLRTRLQESESSGFTPERLIELSLPMGELPVLSEISH